MRDYFQFFILVSFLMLFSACDNKRWEQDVTAIDYEPELKRFEIDFFELGEDKIDESRIEEIEKKYPRLLPLYLNGVLNFGSYRDNGIFPSLNEFVTNKDIQQVYSDVKQAFPKGSLKSEKAEIEKALKLFKYYFPNSDLPELYTLISMFSYNVVVDQKVLALSLDMYLGGEYKYYPSTNIPKYRFKNFEKEFIVSDAVKAFLISEFDREAGMNLLEQMIFYGKIAYLQQAFLPDYEERLFFNYDEAEFNWCDENESEIWFHLVDMELLYTTESEKVRKYIDDAPFIPGFPEGSTAKVGKWLGFQIVKSYMNNNKEVNLADLMANQDANKILLKSKYKPKR